MDLTGWLVVVGIVALFLVVKQLGQASSKTVREVMGRKPVIIDVRTDHEYSSSHLEGTRNLPLGELGQRIEKVLPMGTDRPILLHCHSGTRSAAGVRLLKRKGYTQVFNLGSYGRAQRLLSEASSL